MLTSFFLHTEAAYRQRFRISLPTDSADFNNQYFKASDEFRKRSLSSRLGICFLTINRGLNVLRNIWSLWSFVWASIPSEWKSALIQPVGSLLSSGVSIPQVPQISSCLYVCEVSCAFFFSFSLYIKQTNINPVIFWLGVGISHLHFHPECWSSPHDSVTTLYTCKVLCRHEFVASLDTTKVQKYFAAYWSVLGLNWTLAPRLRFGFQPV